MVDKWHLNKIITLLIIFFALNVTDVYAKDMTPEQLEAWFHDDENMHPVSKTTSNDGELEFLATPPAKKVPYSRNTITISKDSLSSGWVKVEQCHEDLDPVGAIEVVYRYKQMRNLKVKEYTKIGKLWVEGQSVQMEDVEKGARVCMAAEARILIQLPKGRYALFNGPYQRRFLDSYFPMRVNILLRYPASLLKLEKIDPEHTPGYQVKRKRGELHIDTWFAGKLLFRAEFSNNI